MLANVQQTDGTIVIPQKSSSANFGYVYYRTVSTIGNKSDWVKEVYTIDDTSIYVTSATGQSTTPASSRTLTLHLTSCGPTGYGELCYYISDSSMPSSVDISKPPVRCISISNESPQITITESGKYIYFTATNGAGKRTFSPVGWSLYVGTS